MVHLKCRGGLYPFSRITRVPLSDDQVPWSVRLLEYSPPVYNSDTLRNKDWADPDIHDRKFNPKWNEIDGKINRRSHVGEYQIANGRPLNPEGRTGIAGRGVLGRWGPNHAADPIVSRWKRINDEMQFDKLTRLPILQICVIQRKDCDEWALPGGMVDPGEQVSATLKREFMEEATNSLERDAVSVRRDEDMLKEFFAGGSEIYSGYVDDPRNTDNAWIETVAVNFHDDTGKAAGKFSLVAGDDAKNVKWMDMGREVMLYASHWKLAEKVVKLRDGYW